MLWGKFVNFSEFHFSLILLKELLSIGSPSRSSNLSSEVSDFEHLLLLEVFILLNLHPSQALLDLDNRDDNPRDEEHYAKSRNQNRDQVRDRTLIFLFSSVRLRRNCDLFNFYDFKRKRPRLTISHSIYITSISGNVFLNWHLIFNLLVSSLFRRNDNVLFIDDKAVVFASWHRLDNAKIYHNELPFCFEHLICRVIVHVVNALVVRADLPDFVLTQELQLLEVVGFEDCAV